MGNHCGKIENSFTNDDTCLQIGFGKLASSNHRKNVHGCTSEENKRRVRHGRKKVVLTPTTKDE